MAPAGEFALVLIGAAIADTRRAGGDWRGGDDRGDGVDVRHSVLVRASERVAPRGPPKPSRTGR